MKPKASLRFLLGYTSFALLAASPLQALTYYWDSDGDTAGFGNTAGTWGTSAFWTTVAGGGATHSAVTATTNADVVNFGTATLNYGNGSVVVDAGGVTATSIVFGLGQTTALDISGGKITLGGATRTIVANRTGHTISSELALTGDTTVRLAQVVNSGTTTLTLGKLSGTGGVTFESGADQNTLGTFILTQASTYSGNTILQTSGSTNTRAELQLGITNALPTTTVLSLQGTAGTGSGRTTSLNLSGYNQTLGGLSNTGGGTARTFRVFSSSASTLTINDSGNRTFSGLIGNGGTAISIVKQGAGTWTLSGASSYAGTTTISEGAINIQHATALGNSAGGTSVSSGASLQIQGGITVGTEALELNGTGVSADGALRNISGTNAYNGLITLGSDAQIASDAGSLTLGGGITGSGFGFTKTGNGSLTLAAASGYTGLTTINAGAVVVQDASALGTTDAGTVVNGTNSGGTTNARLDLTGGITVTGEALTISGVGNFIGALSSTSGNNVWAGNVTLGAANTRLGASAGASLEVSGTIDSGASSYGLVIRTTDLTGSVILSGANTYLGSTQVAVGKLQLAGGDNRLPVATNLSLASSGTNPDAELDLNGTNQEVAGLSISGSAVATKNSVNNSDVVNLSTLTVNTASSSFTYDGKLNGNLALTKAGGNSLTLNGTNNTYTGATNVNQGTLIVNGNISTSILTTVASGATLSGSGEVGALTIESGGTVAPGNSPGILNAGNYTQAGTYSAEINGLTAGTDHDQINVTGTVDITGGSLNIAAFTGTYTANDLIFILLNDLSDAISGTYTGLAQGAVVTNYGGFDWQISYVADSVGGTFTGGNDIALMAIPEPRAALLGGLGLLALLRRRRA